MVSRRAFLKAVAATAIAVPLAPLAPKPYATGGVLRLEDLERARDIIRADAFPVRKISAWLPISQELLEDIRVYELAPVRWPGVS